jgi:uncharacterized membrane protein
MLNWAFFTPRNFIVIGIMSALALAAINHVMRTTTSTPADDSGATE